MLRTAVTAPLALVGKARPILVGKGARTMNTQLKCATMALANAHYRENDLNFSGAHILAADQFELDDVEKLFRTTDQMQSLRQRKLGTKVLEGAILANMFFEPSTRTRISFASAFNVLGGKVRETTDINASALAKGESLQDTAKVLSGYSDVIVMRHPTPNAVATFASASRTPVINGGDGDAEHPSQACLDLYTIRNEMASRGRDMQKLRIAMVGDLRYGRTVHSLCKILTLYKDIEHYLVAPKGLELPDKYTEALRSAGHKVTIADQLAEGIAKVDIVYMTRIQEERFASQEEANHYRGLLTINQAIYTKYCEPNTAIMHPLPRDNRPNANELDVDLNQNPNLAIFRQADNAIVVRMALFALVLDVTDIVEKHSYPLLWHK